MATDPERLDGGDEGRRGGGRPIFVTDEKVNALSPTPPPPQPSSIPSLRRLLLEGEQHPSPSAATCATSSIPYALDANPQLEELRVSCRSLTPDDLDRLVRAISSLSYPRLRSVTLYRCSGVGDVGAGALAEAWERGSTSLEGLALPYCDVGPVGAGSIARALVARATAAAAGQEIGDFADARAESGRPPCDCPSPPPVRALDLDGNNISGDGVLTLLESVRGTERTLERLNLRHCGIAYRPPSLDVIQSLGRMTALRSLALTCVRLGDEGAERVSSLLARPGCQMEELDLQHCGLSPRGASALASALATNVSLRTLVLTGDEAGRDGLRAFVPVLRERNHTLSSLALPDQDADDERRRRRRRRGQGWVRGRGGSSSNSTTGEGARLLLGRYTNINRKYSPLEAEARKTSILPHRCASRAVPELAVPVTLLYLGKMTMDVDDESDGSCCNAPSSVALSLTFSFIKERYTDLFGGIE